jgi:transcriptional regulator with XRE-family HTH domain
MHNALQSGLIAETANRRSLIASLPAPERRRELRRQYKITRVQVADYLGVDHRTWDNYESGKIVPEDTATLEKLSIFYRVMYGELELIPETTRAPR